MVQRRYDEPATAFLASGDAAGAAEIVFCKAASQILISLLNLYLFLT